MELSPLKRSIAAAKKRKQKVLGRVGLQKEWGCHPYMVWFFIPFSGLKVKNTFVYSRNELYADGEREGVRTELWVWAFVDVLFFASSSLSKLSVTCLLTVFLQKVSVHILSGSLS